MEIQPLRNASYSRPDSHGAGAGDTWLADSRIDDMISAEVCDPWVT